jgi:cytochrome b-561
LKPVLKKNGLATTLNMIFCMIYFFLSNLKAILIYRIFPRTKKIIVKIVHAVLQVGVMAFAITALIAAFDSHNKRDQPIPNMYSLHSWVGLVAVILFSLQWVIGFVSFLFPKLSDGLRAAYLPHHKFWGLAIFTLICAAALMGITEKAFFSLPK